MYIETFISIDLKNHLLALVNKNKLVNYLGEFVNTCFNEKKIISRKLRWMTRKMNLGY